MAAILTGGLIGLRNSMVIEMLAITLIGCVCTVAWLYYAGFYALFEPSSAVIITSICYFVGCILGFVVRITVQRLMPKPQ